MKTAEENHVLHKQILRLKRQAIDCIEEIERIYTELEGELGLDDAQEFHSIKSSIKEL